MTKNIKNLKEFLDSKNILIINAIDENTNSFYLYLISHYAKKYNYEVTIKEETYIDNSQSDDLFSSPKIEIYPKISSKNLNKALQKSDKKIFFIDYKNFKSLSSQYSSINAYNIKADMSLLLVDELNITNTELLNFLLNSPEYTYSEISKALINQKDYAKLLIDNNDDKIASIRKEIFKKQTDIKTNFKLFYSLIKKEVELKKFNFLTY